MDVAHCRREVSRIVAVTTPLNEQALLWSSLDVDGVITVALSHMLRELMAAEAQRAGWLRAADHPQLLQLLAANRLGLVLWTVQEEAQLPRLCESLCDVRERSPETICVVYAEQLHWELLSSLIEAGAQVVVRDVPGLQRGLASLIRAAPRSHHGLHPLTAGLIARIDLHLPAP